MSDDELAIAQAPYLVTRRWVKERYQRWGPNHPMYRARVLGEFPEQSEVSVYSLSWIEKASQEGPEIPNDGSVRVIQVGIDVAMSERICGTRDTKYTASTLAPLH